MFRNRFVATGILQPFHALPKDDSRLTNMFANRRSSQKPDEQLYAAFKQNFPQIGPGTSTSSAEPGPGPAATRATLLSEALVNAPASSCHRPFENEERKEQDMTPKSFQDHWRFTPSLMDPTSFAFSAFANQPPGYYTPTPGGFTTVYHNQAGDLHTPGMGLNTPLSLPHSIHTLHEADPTMHGHNFNPHFLHHPPPFHDPFAPLAQPPPQQMQQPFAAAHFLQHQDSGYAGMGESSHQTTPTQSEMPMGSSTLHNHAPHAFIRGVVARPKDLSQGGEKFRYHTTLNAPTAMIRHADEIPITYLNKGQAYTMSIYDTAPPLPQARAVLKYRTYVRVSFEDEQQRARPRACWQLWKEGRGSNEAHQRGGKLLAVEYVDPNQGGDDELRKSHIQLEKASFDGFAVTWYPNPAGRGPDCSISVRFNFLSTDFSHSKGVKGIPVRLCAKTELLTPQTSASNDAEVCFSKVKLFRDHGAERKLSNDVAHVRKSIDKLKQQIAQAEAGIGNGSKRKRSGSMAKTGSTSGKPIGHKRTWSMDSNAEPGKLPAEEDLQMKLVSMQDMFSSTRPVSTLFLRGDPEDDPDLHPVALAGGNDVVDMKAMAQTATSESRPSASDSPTSNAVSPTASSGSRTTPKRKLSPEVPPTGMLQGPANESYSDWDAPARPVKITKLENGSGVMSSLFVVDVDGNYRPPAERPIKPVACFYVRQKDAVKEYYRAIYLMQRTVRDLIDAISAKFHVEPCRVVQVTHINSRGLPIIVDEDVVRELPEGQDMTVEFAPVQPEKPVKREFAPTVATEIIADNDLGPPVDVFASDPLEVWLNY